MVFDWPDTAIEGTDDKGVNDEDNNPYSSTEILSYSEKRGQATAPAVTGTIGKIASFDCPDIPFLNIVCGQIGEELSARSKFREFVRLQIGNRGEAGARNWYAISDSLPWTYSVLFRNLNGSMTCVNGQITVP